VRVQSAKLASAERTNILLRAAARVARNVISILDPDELRHRTVDIICDEFGFYYAGVFLIDESGQWAVLRAGRGAAGARMIAEGHKLAVGGDSMIGAATGRREARIALDVGAEAVFFKNPHLPDTRSEMALPLIVGDEVIGALTVQSKEEAAFTQEDITTLQSMADQLAIAIKNSRLHRQNQALLQQAERRARLLQAANQVGQRATSIRDLSELLPQTVDIICAAYGFYYAGVFLLDESGQFAVLRAGRGEAGARMIAEGHRLAVGGRSMIGAAIARRAARIALDVDEETAFFKNPHLPNTRSEMALPLVVGDDVLGAVTVQSVEERAFSADDITTLQTMADHLAIAIHNAQVLQQLEQANRELLRTKTFEVLSTATTQAIHWIGNKLLPMTTAIARIQDDLSSGNIDPDSLREDIGLIAHSAWQIIDVKEQLLGPAREQQPRPALLSDVVQAAAAHMGLHPQQVNIEVAPDTPLALADTTQLTRVVGNLLRNAIEANASRITAAIQPAQESGFVSMRIADDGDGIPPEMLSDIWTSFVTSKGSQHNGLGLPATLHVITQLLGQISVESKAGKTVFTILLPASADTTRTEWKTSADHIVLIDDNDDWAHFVMETLRAAGKKATQQSNVDGETDRADVIIVDAALMARPVADVLAALRNAGAGGKTIVVTAALNVETTTAYLQAGARDVVLKPYTLQELAALLA
jgi:GAF domain-containing protein